MENFRHGAIHRPFRRKIHRAYRKLTGKRVARGTGVDWTKGSQFRSKLANLPQENQGDNDSCGGQAGSYFVQIQRILQGINEGKISAKSIYDPIAYAGGGTTIGDLMSQIGSRGANLESDVPSYDSSGNPLTETLMTDKSSQTPALLKDAMTRAGYTPYDIDIDIEAVAEAINTYGAAIWQIAGQNGNPLGWRSPAPQPPVSSNTLNPIWYHFMCANDFEIDENGNKRIIALQSEGPTWGDNGKQYFYENYFVPQFMDPFTFIYDLRLVPNSDNFSIGANLVRWFKTYLASLNLT